MKINWNVEAHVVAMDIMPPVDTNLLPIKPKTPKMEKPMKTNT